MSFRSLIRKLGKESQFLHRFGIFKILYVCVYGTDDREDDFPAFARAGIQRCRREVRGVLITAKPGQGGAMMLTPPCNSLRTRRVPGDSASLSLLGPSCPGQVCGRLQASAGHREAPTLWPWPPALLSWAHSTEAAGRSQTPRARPPGDSPVAAPGVTAGSCCFSWVSAPLSLTIS